MRPYAPDIKNPYPSFHGGGNNGGNNGQGGPNMMPAFQPGQLKALANQLNMGFGGGVQSWRQDMRKTYDPTSMRGFNFGGGNGGGNRNGNDGGKGPKDDRQSDDGGFTPVMPRHRMAMPAGGGLLSAPMQQPQQQGLLGPIPPEVLAYINMRR